MIPISGVVWEFSENDPAENVPGIPLYESKDIIEVGRDIVLTNDFYIKGGSSP